MNFTEIYEKLKQTPKNELLKAKTILEEYSSINRSNWLKNINKNNPKPLDYLVNACIEDDYNNERANRQNLLYQELNTFSLFVVRNWQHVQAQRDKLLENINAQIVLYNKYTKALSITYTMLEEEFKKDIQP